MTRLSTWFVWLASEDAFSSRASRVFLVVVALALYGFGLTWGLPNGETTWAPDALAPTIPLATVYELFFKDWNSGWFDWKYPPGHGLLLATAYAPYLGWLRASGQLSPSVIVEYPYGLADPEHALWVLALIGRSVSVVMMLAATLLWYAACRELFSPRAAWLAAWFTATMYPVVYYAHTTNVDGPLLFWIVVAVYGAARVLARRDDPFGMLCFGVGFAFALATKESAFGALIAFPVLLLAERRRRGSGEATGLLPPGTLTGMALAVGIFSVMYGVAPNPLGAWHRLQFLTHTISESVRELYAPRYHPVGSAAFRSLGTEAAHLLETHVVMSACLGLPVLVLAILGVVRWGWRAPAVYFAVPAILYYALSVRALQTVRPRFVMPLCVFATIFVGLVLDRWTARARSRSSRALMGAMLALLIVTSGLRGAEVVRMMVGDPRYAAEGWLQALVSPGARIEVYQSPIYLPRFPATASVARIPFEDITIEAFARRLPDYVVVSSAGITGITSRYNEDWSLEIDDSEARSVMGRGIDGQALTIEFAENREFLNALRAEHFGFTRVATFEPRFLFAPRIIKGMSPEVEIYGRSPVAPQVERPDARERPRA